MNFYTSLLAAGAISLLPFAAGAATISASQGLQSNGLAVAADRSDLASVTDGDPNTFFSLGIGGSLTADVSPDLVGNSNVVEVTFRNNDNFPESALVFIGQTLLGELFNIASGIATTSTGTNGSSLSVVTNTASGLTTFLINVGANVGPTLTLTDTTMLNFASFFNPTTTTISDGFDVGEFNVTAVPVPAAGLLLLAGLGGLAALKRRKTA